MNRLQSRTDSGLNPEDGGQKHTSCGTENTLHRRALPDFNNQKKFADIVLSNSIKFSCLFQSIHCGSSFGLPMDWFEIL